MSAAAAAQPGADGVARTAAGRRMDLRTLADRRAMRKMTARAIAAIEQDHGRLPEPAREGLALGTAPIRHWGG